MERALVSRAFTLAEVLLAVGLAVVVILALLGMGLSVVRSDQKSVDTLSGQSVADGLLEDFLHQAAKDAADPLWAANSQTQPYQEGQVQVGATSFTYRVYAYDIDVPAPITPAPPGVPLTIKKVNVLVNWWGSDIADRSGYGNLRAYATRTTQIP